VTKLVSTYLLALTLTSCLLSSCTRSYQFINQGDTQVGALKLALSDDWNQLPDSEVLNGRPETRVWTQHGIWLDRLMIIPSTPKGQPVFIPKKPGFREQQAINRGNQEKPTVPKALTFNPDMQPHFIRRLVRVSMLEFLGNTATINTANLRPYTFSNGLSGFAFDLDAQFPQSPLYKGIAAWFIHDEELYLLIYLAATPHYFDTYAPGALEVINSARIVNVQKSP
jgi:hypothetical protein